jgi:hypothetical protein
MFHSSTLVWNSHGSLKMPRLGSRIRNSMIHTRSKPGNNTIGPLLPTMNPVQATSSHARRRDSTRGRHKRRRLMHGDDHRSQTGPSRLRLTGGGGDGAAECPSDEQDGGDLGVDEWDGPALGGDRARKGPRGCTLRCMHSVSAMHGMIDMMSN